MNTATETEVKCDTCKDTGEVEKLEYECNDSTGYNTVVMGTGQYEACPDCAL